MAPFVVPGIVLAIGFFSAYAHPPIRLYGTAGILIAAFATRFLPIPYSNASSMAQNVAFGLQVRKVPRDDIKRRMDAILGMVRMRPLANRHPAELSGGQQQRVALARALVARTSCCSTSRCRTWTPTCARR
jgi:hypothetical protein